MVTLDNGGAGRDTVVFLPTPRTLAWAVEHTWAEGARRRHTSPRASWRIVPDPASHLIYSRSWSSRSPAGRLRLVGPRSVHLDVDQSRRSLTVGLRLRPGVLPILIDAPAGELLDRSASLDRWCHPAHMDAVEEWEDLGPNAVARRLHGLILESADRSRLDWKVRAAARAVLGAHGRCRADDVSRRTGIPGRTLRAALWEGLGMGLKRFARLQRLHRSIGLGLTRSAGSLSNVALEAGYSDQAHMIRDFRMLLGETPARFLARGTSDGFARGPGGAAGGPHRAGPA